MQQLDSRVVYQVRLNTQFVVITRLFCKVLLFPYEWHTKFCEFHRPRDSNRSNCLSDSRKQLQSHATRDAAVVRGLPQTKEQQFEQSIFTFFFIFHGQLELLYQGAAVYTVSGVTALGCSRAARYAGMYGRAFSVAVLAPITAAMHSR